MGQVEQSDRPMYFDPQIPGLECLLYQAGNCGEDRGFAYYPRGGLNIVIYGPPGIGKTVMALQMAVAAAFPKPGKDREQRPPEAGGRKVIYLTKDTSAGVLMRRLEDSFGFFAGEGAQGRGDMAGFSDRCFSLHELSTGLEKWRVQGRRADDGTTGPCPLKPLEEGGCLIFGDFSANASVASCIDRYATTDSVFHALGQLAPAYCGVFDAMCHQLTENGEPKESISDWGSHLLVVCDSLSPEMLEEHLHVQEAYGQRLLHDDPKARVGGQPIFVFIMESTELPRSISVAFPPDVQIRLGVRDEGQGFSTSVMQLLKTRFQKSVKQETPFLVVGSEHGDLVASERTVRVVRPVEKGTNLRMEFKPAIKQEDTEKSGIPTIFSRRRAGINIMPPLACGELAPRDGVSDRELMQIRFGIERLDAMTEEGSLAGGGCTLLITQNRTGSTALSLYYLLAQAGERVEFMDRAQRLFREWFLNPKAVEDEPQFVALRAVWAAWPGFVRLLCQGGGGDEGIAAVFGPDIRAQAARDNETPRHHLGLLIAGLLPAAHVHRAEELAKKLILILRHPLRSIAIPGEKQDGQKETGNALTQDMVRRCYWNLADRMDEQLRIGLDALKTTKALMFNASVRSLLAAGVGTPKSVLYVSFSGDVLGILHTIWRHPTLRHALTGPDCEGDVGKAWDRMCYELEKDAQNSSSCAHRLYRVPLHHLLTDDSLFPLPEKCRCEGRTPYLYIYVPDFSWVTIEEAVDRMVQLLRFECHCDMDGQREECFRCLQVDRVVLDRVGRVASRWPLVGKQNTFISRVAGLCAQHSVELMLVDDTADEESAIGLYRSQWTSIAQNVIRLRRLPFHGSEALTIEMIRASGRQIVVKRPQEILFDRGASGNEEKMMVRDSFRGFTGLSAGQPQRCTLKVDLSYDVERTPLHRDTLAMQRNLENTMDGVSVRVMGPGQWSGVNSAFNNLSDASRDTCHVVSIDGVWLQRLLEMGVLARLTESELREVVPRNVRTAIWGNETEPDFGPNLTSEDISKGLDQQYVTRSITTAMARIERKFGRDCLPLQSGMHQDGFYYAVPMRHNWGILTIAKLSRDYMRHVFGTLLPKAVSEEETPASDEMGKPPVSSGETEPIVKLIRQKTDAPGKGGPEAGTRGELIGLMLAFLKGIPGSVSSEPTDTVLLRKVYDALWKESPEIALTWEDLAEFRTRFWHPFWQGGWIEKALNSLTNKVETKSDPWVYLFPRIDFFNFTMTTEESVVAFFLEILLAKVEWEVLFHEEENQAIPLLSFQSGARTEDGFTQALLLMFRLLSSTQRRQISIGVRTGHDEIGVLRRNAEAGFGADSSFADWPSSIALFSRQWVTSVQDLFPRYDIREKMRWCALPVSASDDTRAGEAGAKPKDHGPTVAGTWYLGILRGGNADLGTDVMKELLSEEHELSRLLNRSGAPVTKQFYTEELIACKGKSVSSALPYADEVRKTCEDVGEGKGPFGKDARYYPFHRTRIVDYPEVSSVLYDLVREVMRLQSEDEQEIESLLEAPVRELVQRALRRLAKVQSVGEIAADHGAAL